MQNYPLTRFYSIDAAAAVTPWRVLLILFLLSLAILSAPVAAADWRGSEVNKNGIPHMMNPAQPIEAPASIKLDKLWHVRGDDDEFLFGVLTQITSDESGNMYVLDAQLHQVMVFSPDGEYLRSIGRQGEGPGEFNRPSDLFMTVDGNVAVMQGMPGKIVLMTPEGEPAGNHPVPEPEDGGMQMFSSGQLAGTQLVLSAERFSRREDGMTISSALIGVDKMGKQVATYFTQEDKRDFANLTFDEKKMRDNAITWSAAGNGRVFASDNFDAYHIKVYKADGSLERVIEREYQSRVRSAKEIEDNTPRVMIRSGNQSQTPEVKASGTDRDIQRIYPRKDGTIWVLSSRGAFDAPDGAIATFDIYDSEGKFVRQVTLEGEDSFTKDGFHFVKDRFYVVTGLRSARRAMYGGDSEDEDDIAEDEEPMGIICYDMSEIIQSKK
ncbi:MAG: 6-bladed beta-propeller [Candidatus Latescibacterota bacterium]